MVMIIIYWTETGPTAHVATSHDQSMVVRGHGVAHGGHQWGKNGKNGYFHGKSHFFDSPKCRNSHVMGENW